MAKDYAGTRKPTQADKRHAEEVVKQLEKYQTGLSSFVEEMRKLEQETGFQILGKAEMTVNGKPYRDNQGRV